MEQDEPVQELEMELAVSELLKQEQRALVPALVPALVLALNWAVEDLLLSGLLLRTPRNSIRSMP